MKKSWFVFGAVLACAGGVWADVAVSEFITDTSGYVTLTADDPGGQPSFNTAGRWSDGAAPSGTKDYLVNGNHILRVLSSTTFAGRSLTLDNGRIKTGSGADTVTIDDLRIYGGRLEQSQTASTKTYAGNVRVYGTAAVPARISGSSGRTFHIASTLTGDAENVVKVMMTEEDEGTMTAVYFPCWFDADNAATYRGRFIVASGSSSKGYGYKIALAATTLANLGAGDPDASTSVLTLKDRAAFMPAEGFVWTNAAYSIALDGCGTFSVTPRPTGDASNEPYGFTLDGGVAVRGLAAGAVLRTRGTGSTFLGDVTLSNIGSIIVEANTLVLGSAFADSGIPVEVQSGTELAGTAAGAGAVTFAAGTAFAPGLTDGATGTLTCASATVNGIVTGRVDIVRESGALGADRLVCTGKLVKGSGGRIVFNIGSFPSGTDWEGSVKLLTATNLGESDGFGTADVEITGFPPAWTVARTAGRFQIVADGATKSLVWNAEVTETPTIRILPLGDSITYGSQSACAGYRQPLYEQLVAAGYDVDFVGTLQTSAGTGVTDPDHEGHRGWVIARDGNPDRCGQNADGYDGLYENVASWLETIGSANAPHFVLLHIGTNDLLGDDFAHAKDRLGLLVDRLNELLPSAWIVVTTLLDRYDSDSYREQIRTLFNPYVAEIVASRRRIGRRVHYLDLNAVVPASELADQLHPNDTGYGHIAEAWFGAIQTLMPSTKVAPSATRADLVTLTGVDAMGLTSWNTALNWSNGLAPLAGSYYFVPTNTVLRTPEGWWDLSFAGDSLVLNGGNVNLKCAHGSTVRANWVVYNSRLAHGCNGTKDPTTQKPVAHTQTVAGTLDVRGTAEAPTTFSGTGAGTAGGYSRQTIVSAALTGADDAVIRVTYTPGENETAEGAASGNTFLCRFTGDNSAYRGGFVLDHGTCAQPSVYRTTFPNQTALGAPCAGGAKMTVKPQHTLAGTALAFTNGYAFALEGAAGIVAEGGGTITGRTPSEGIYFGQGGSITGTGADSDTLTIKTGAVIFDDVAISGVAKIVDRATLRFYPGYNQPTVPIEVSGRGRLAVGADGVGPVTVKTGSDIQPGYGVENALAIGSFGLAALTVEDGGRLIYSAIKFGNDLSNDFIRVYGNLAKTGAQIPIEFDRYPQDLPQGTAIPLLAAANLGTDLTAADFAIRFQDACLSTVISGTCEIRDVNGTNTLFYVQSSNPVIILTEQDVSGADSWARGTHWSNNSAPDADHDYRVLGLLRRSMGADDATFKGHSLSITDGGDFAINGLTANIADLRLFSGGTLTTRSNGAGNRLTGTATVYAAKGNPFNFAIETDVSRTLNLAATLKGTGDLRFRYYFDRKEAAKAPGTTFYLVTGNNTDFTGGIELYQSAITADFKNEAAMGGPAETFRADRLRFTSNAVLRCSSSYVMCDPTRGITFGAGIVSNTAYAGGVPQDGGTIKVEAGQTLTISNLISGTTSFRKQGTGTLILACETNVFSGTVRNQASGGVLAIAAAGAVAQANVQTEPGSVWRVDVPEGITLKGLDAIVAYGDTYRGFPVRPGVFENLPKGLGRIDVNLVRIQGATAAEADAALQLVTLDASTLGKGWKTEVTAESVEGALLVKVTARREGCVIYIR